MDRKEYRYDGDKMQEMIEWAQDNKDSVTGYLTPIQGDMLAIQSEIKAIIAMKALYTGLSQKYETKAQIYSLQNSVYSSKLVKIFGSMLMLLAFM